MNTLQEPSKTLFVMTEEDVREFYREAYIVARNFISSKSVDIINTSYESGIETLAGRKEWKGLPFSEAAQKELYTTRVIEGLELLMGGELELWLGMYAVVMPGGNGLAWHQDNQYTHVLGHMCNAFVAWDTITQENAGLWIAPRSHLLGRLPNENKEPGHRRAAEPANATPAPDLNPGDAVIFHREFLHHSKINHTDRPRRAFAFQIANKNCRFAKTGELVTSEEKC